MPIVARTFDPDGSSALHDPVEISELIERRGCLVWVDLVEPDDADFEMLAEEFALHHLAIEDARKHGQRPKLERYPDHSFLVAYSREMAEVDLFIGPNWLITVRERNEAGQHFHFEGIRTRFDEDKGPMTVGHLVYIVLDEIVDGYLAAVEEIEDRVQDLEEQILLEQPSTDQPLQVELLSVRKALLQFRRAAHPLREAVGRLVRGEVAAIDDETRVHLRDVEDHLLRVLDNLEADREMVANVVDALHAQLSKRMNQVMKRTTSWGALLLGTTLIAGIYGMNFEHMPELGWRFGYLWALGLMATTTYVGYRYFKRKDWL